ncbi:hypothetical protein [Streptomyces sp. NPDC006333]|uniref:hypothetical protein n=1 Tax=Streptomyces sp. NPDC006333 TaxID=3156753 RepID=UPI0033B8E67A
MQSFEITYQTFGPTFPPIRTSGLSEGEAHRFVGANTLAGFTPVVHTKDVRGEQLRTRDGNVLTVVAIHGNRLVSVMEFEHI